MAAAKCPPNFPIRQLPSRMSNPGTHAAAGRFDAIDAAPLAGRAVMGAIVGCIVAMDANRNQLAGAALGDAERETGS